MRLSVRALHEALGAHGQPVTPGQGSLEATLPGQEPERTRDAPLLHEAAMGARAVGAPTGTEAFGAFLDGVQESRVVAYVGVHPVVAGRTGAVVRARVARRLVTWGAGPLVGEALYAPVAQLPAGVAEALAGTGWPVVDTMGGPGPEASSHPQHWLRQAVHLVQRAREAQERALAEAWCAAPDAPPLYLDGGLPAAPAVLASAGAVGVVKSHHTLYASGAALGVVCALRAGERSSVFVVETRWRPPVASWYLRLRAPAGREPLWGLVRLESPLEVLGAGAAADAEADRRSRWVLAEAAPLSLPDARWDTMAYGIRDCEVFLRATLGAAGR